MNNKIRIGICGYGKLGRGVESELGKHSEYELAAIFTRRDPAGVNPIDPGVPVVSADGAVAWKGKIDVMLLCGGSANTLPVQGPALAAHFNTIDSFDTHAKIPDYFKAVDSAARAGGNVSVISVGWDPGLFSLMRLYTTAILPVGSTYTFWGKGVSQGHSEAVRGLEGVIDAVQYTVPNDDALTRARGGENPLLTTREKHTRLCYVVAAEEADKAGIERKIKKMPHYFDEYDTTVEFIGADELKANHGGLPHGGRVIRAGTTGHGNKQIAEFSLALDSNPEFTASVLLACARAAFRLSQKGERGARTIFDIPPVLLSPLSAEEAVKRLL